MPFTTSFITSVFYAGNALPGNANKTTAAGCELELIWMWMKSIRAAVSQAYHPRSSQPGSLSLQLSARSPPQDQPGLPSLKFASANPKQSSHLPCYTLGRSQPARGSRKGSRLLKQQDRRSRIDCVEKRQHPSSTMVLFSVKKHGKTSENSNRWAIQRPQHEEPPSGCELSYGEMPFYVKIAIEEALPAGWTLTGLAERAKIKVQIGRKWWQLPKVHAECVFGQLIHRDTTLAKYAWLSLIHI